MSESESESDPFDYVSPSDLESPHANQRRDAISRVQIENDDWPDELAIFDASGELAEQAWISASGESFVALADWR
ncbi:hypothetical protein CP556_24940 [Natrinema sp. CBA1119]|uniref:DUF7511 domain-containing protein n=1 Tax=Natrinema sp. CBA1119 TaxID=1608465 RepID=UPI000BF6D05D|nr:hypothetical protein [Natrinema sp. CBA1119]PGF14255.1 hypothetical protein CP556_24940 [Natrinema sp. CBA1119]